MTEDDVRTAGRATGPARGSPRRRRVHVHPRPWCHRRRPRTPRGRLLGPEGVEGGDAVGPRSPRATADPPAHRPRQASTATELAATSGLGTTGQVYHHLKQLVSAGWLRGGARGTHHIPPERLVTLLVVLGATQ